MQEAYQSIFLIHFWTFWKFSRIPLCSIKHQDFSRGFLSTGNWVLQAFKVTGWLAKVYLHYWAGHCIGYIVIWSCVSFQSQKSTTCIWKGNQALPVADKNSRKFYVDVCLARSWSMKFPLILKQSMQNHFFLSRIAVVHLLILPPHGKVVWMVEMTNGNPNAHLVKAVSVRRMWMK